MIRHKQQAARATVIRQSFRRSNDGGVNCGSRSFALTKVRIYILNTSNDEQQQNRNLISSTAPSCCCRLRLPIYQATDAWALTRTVAETVATRTYI